MPHKIFISLKAVLEAKNDANKCCDCVQEGHKKLRQVPNQELINKRIDK